MPGPAANQVPARHQPQDGKDARPDRAETKLLALADEGDRMKRARSSRCSARRQDGQLRHGRNSRQMPMIAADRCVVRRQAMPIRRVRAGLAAFAKGMQELGWTRGANIAIGTAGLMATPAECGCWQKS